MSSESSVLSEILKALRRHPSVAIVWRQTVGTFQRANRWVTVGEKGQPDVMGMTTDGRLFGIEVKDEGKVSVDQWRWIQCISQFGGRAGVARSAEAAIAIVTTPVQCSSEVCGGRAVANTSGGEGSD